MSLALASAVAVLGAGCHGPKVNVEPGPGSGGAGIGVAGSGGGVAGSGGGVAGSGGNGGRGGGVAGGVAGRGGAGGAPGGRGGGTATGGVGACVALTQPPAPFVTFTGAVNVLETIVTDSRYYWLREGPAISLQYLSGTSVVTHPLTFDYSSNVHYDLAATDQLVVGMWSRALNSDSTITAYGPDMGAGQLGSTIQMSAPGAIAAHGGTVYFKYTPPVGNPDTPGIYVWSPPGPPQLYASYAQLGLVASDVLILATTPSWLLIAGSLDAWAVSRSSAGAAQPLFHSPNNKVIYDVRPALPHTLDGGVLIQVADGVFNGRDFYVNVGHIGAAAVDLSVPINQLAASVCSQVRYDGFGALYQNRYVYQGTPGLVAVDVASDGTVGNLQRLFDAYLFQPNITGTGTLFGITLPTLDWTLYQLGQL